MARRIRLPGLGQYKTERDMTEEDRHWDTADRQNTAGGGIIEKNPGARTQDGNENVFDLSGVRLCNNSSAC
jgi:hypothetical protein